jgi:hypothetical protein
VALARQMTKQPQAAGEPVAERIPWPLEAVAKTASGILLGLITSILVVLASHLLFPSLADFDYDLGLQMQTWADLKLQFGATSLRSSNKDKAYLFLDVDPRPTGSADESTDTPQPTGGAAPSTACASLIRQYPGRYSPVSSKENGKASLNCSDARPLNRYVLAELVKGLRERGAALIVLDVELAPALDVVDAQETSALQTALWDGVAGAPTVIYADPVEFVSADRTSDAILTASKHNPDFDAPEHPGPGRDLVMSAIALPAPGVPLRRYPKCVLDVSHDRRPVPSLPYLTAKLIDNPRVDPASICDVRQVNGSDDSREEHDNLLEPARIHYTLQSLRAHQDATLDGDDFKRWSVYRSVYNRCIAAQFWQKDSQCSDAQTYRGKVVVIGASNPVRRDQHYTPIGSMAGPEVVINAVRSFELYSHEHEKSVPQAIWAKTLIVLECGLVWLAFYLMRCLLDRSRTGAPLAKRFSMSCAVFALFCVASSVVLVMTFRASYSSLSVLVAVMAIAIEQYVEVVTKFVLHPFEHMLEHWLRLLNATARKLFARGGHGDAK